MGSWVWSTLASSAVTNITTMSTPPAAPRGFLRTNRDTTVHAESRRGLAAGAAAMSTGVTAIQRPRSAGIAHARVEDAVQQVEGEVGEDHHDRDKHDQVLDDRVIPPQDRLD